MATIIVKSGPRVISGNDCGIGKYYRRYSDPKKVYLCSRDVSRDTYGGSSSNPIVHGRMLVSLAHGNRMTAKMTDVDFIEVEVVIEATDVLK